MARDFRSGHRAVWTISQCTPCKRVLAKVTAEVEYAVVPKAVPKSGSRSQIEPSPGSLPKVSVTVT
eukprot:1151933-Amorphochlora_amoeboformis.AAC.1